MSGGLQAGRQSVPYAEYYPSGAQVLMENDTSRPRGLDDLLVSYVSRDCRSSVRAPSEEEPPLQGPSVDCRPRSILIAIWFATFIVNLARKCPVRRHATLVWGAANMAALARVSINPPRPTMAGSFTPLERSI